MKIKADLHIHSCLSPCGSLEMSPTAIVKKAVATGLNAAAITDHNSALNCRAFGTCCKESNILPIFGIEVTSLEEAHILCLFETPEQAEALGEIIYKKLPDIPNDPERFGDQVYVDAEENILGEVDKYLVTAAELSLDELFDIVTKLNGMYIPAHINKPVFSIPSQLGFLPQMDYTALETTVMPCPIETGNIPLIKNSDAHYLDNIAERYSVFDCKSPSFNQIKAAILSGTYSIY